MNYLLDIPSHLVQQGKKRLCVIKEIVDFLPSLCTQELLVQRGSSIFEVCHQKNAAIFFSKQRLRKMFGELKSCPFTSKLLPIFLCKTYSGGLK